MTVLDSLERQVHRTGIWAPYGNPRIAYVEGDGHRLLLDILVNARHHVQKVVVACRDLRVDSRGRGLPRADARDGRRRLPARQHWAELIEWAKGSLDLAVDFFDRALAKLQARGLVIRSRA